MKTAFDWSRQTEKQIMNALSEWLYKQDENTPNHINGVIVTHISIDAIFDKISSIFRKNTNEQLHEEMIDQNKRSKQQFDGITELIKHYSGD